MVLVIKTFPFLMALRHLETFFPPKPFYLLVIDLPAFNAKQRSNLSVRNQAPHRGQRTTTSIPQGIMVLIQGVRDNFPKKRNREFSEWNREQIFQNRDLFLQTMNSNDLARADVGLASNTLCLTTSPRDEAPNSFERTLRN